ncbi:MAG: hypothetical protein RIR70_1019 [Pseudomonadota bacterium]
MSRAIEILKHEHEAIIAALNLLDTFTQQLSADQAVNGDDLHALLGLLSEFADKCHHGKEEDLLIPALVKAGLSAGGGPLASVMNEHAEGRRLLRVMEEAAAPPLNLADFASAAERYSALLRAHIEKENEALFPMAEEVLTQTQLNTLADAFEEHEIKVIGHGRHESLHALLKRLQKRYLM